MEFKVTKEIFLNRNKIVIVDDEDYEELSKYKWTATQYGHLWYARSWMTKTPNRKRISMHKFLLGSKDKMFVDHINGDGLDNRRCNLRFVTHFQNGQNQKASSLNTSGCRGVNYMKYAKQWAARITINGERIFLGNFDEFDVAVGIRRLAEEIYFGEFSRK